MSHEDTFPSQHFSFPCQYHSTNATYTFIHLPPTLYNVSVPVLQFSPLSIIPPMLHAHMHFNDMIYYLTAIGLTPGGSNTAHIYTQTVHRTTQSTQTNMYNNTIQYLGRVRTVPRICEVYPDICLKT